MMPTVFSLLTIFLSICSATQGAFDDVPMQCQSVCGSLAEASNQCETLAGSNDTDSYIACVCNGQGARAAIPQCEACINAVKQSLNPNQGPREWSQDDANRLIPRCGLQRISSYDINRPSSTLEVVANTAVVSGSTVIPTETDASSDHVTGAATGPSTAAGAVSPTTSTSSSSHVQNLAAVPSMGVQGINFVAGMGLLIAAALL